MEEVANIGDQIDATDGFLSSRLANILSLANMNNKYVTNVNFHKW